MIEDAILIGGLGVVGYYIYTQYANPLPATPSALQTALALSSNGAPSPVPVTPSAPSKTGNSITQLSNFFSNLLNPPDNSVQPANDSISGDNITSSGQSINSDGGYLSNPMDSFIPISAVDTTGSGDPLDIAKQRLISEEGQRFSVYLDPLGIPTAGIGHKITTADNLRVGDSVTQSQIDAWFARDTYSSYVAAQQQATDLGHGNDVNFIAALIDVNYQLGTGWPSIFPTTYKYLKQGDAQTAILNIEDSLWYRQTPERAQNFANAIQLTYGVA